ncbi:MAG: hypothetical protein WBO37_04310 [Gammaproteobacteria bacterium]
MNILDSVLFGLLAGLITLKVLLLAAAAVLLVHVLTQRPRQNRATPAPPRVKVPRLDVHA